MMSCMTSASSPSIVVCMAPSLKGSPEASISGIIPATNSPSPSPTPKGATEKLASMMDLQSSRNDSAYGASAARLYRVQYTTSRSGRPPNPDSEVTGLRPGGCPVNAGLSADLSLFVNPAGGFPADCSSQEREARANLEDVGPRCTGVWKLVTV